MVNSYEYADTMRKSPYGVHKAKRKIRVLAQLVNYLPVNFLPLVAVVSWEFAHN